MSHAMLSPSSAERWLNCTPSAKLEYALPDTSSTYAREGSLAHKLGETMLQYELGLISEVKHQKIIAEIESDELYSEAMWDHATDYKTFVLEQFNLAKQQTPDATIFLEQKLNLTDYVKEGFGTIDCAIIADGTLSIIDLKYGKGVAVSCENNKQMMLYALGVLAEMAHIYDITEVSMTIYQPRIDNISTWTLPVDKLMDFANNFLMPRAKLAWEGKGEFVPGKHCQFCKIRTTCKALAEENMKMVEYAFTDTNKLSDDDFVDILTRSDLFIKWITDITDYMFDQAINHGKEWPGFKVVEGRSKRIYTDEEGISSTLSEAGFTEEQYCKPKELVGITAMEKLLGKKRFAALLGQFTEKPEGKPTLVPESDKRPVFNSAAKAFENI